MLLDGSNLDLVEIESKIIQYLKDAEELDSNVQNACAQFEMTLAKLLRLLPGNCPWRYWDLDDFYCNGFHRRDQIVTLKGVPYWLSGGEKCNSFRIDVDIDKDPLLYSFKFKNSKSGKQILYIGKISDGWVVNGA